MFEPRSLLNLYVRKFPVTCGSLPPIKLEKSLNNIKCVEMTLNPFNYLLMLIKSQLVEISFYTRLLNIYLSLFGLIGIIFVLYRLMILSN